MHPLKEKTTIRLVRINAHFFMGKYRFSLLTCLQLSANGKSEQPE